MSTKEEIFNYVTTTPENTNPAVVRSLLNDLETSDGLPPSTEEDAGKVLTVGSTGAAEWTEPSGGAEPYIIKITTEEVENPFGGGTNTILTVDETTPITTATLNAALSAGGVVRCELDAGAAALVAGGFTYVDLVLCATTNEELRYRSAMWWQTEKNGAVTVYAFIITFEDDTPRVDVLHIVVVEGA